MTMTAQTKTPLPAYISFRTLNDLLDRMRKEVPPTQIDRSYLETYSGGYQSQILSSLEWLGLIDSEGRLTEDFKRLVQVEETEQKEVLAGILKKKYPQLISLAEANTTQRQFEDALRAMGPKGETVRKAGAFYLHAAAFSGVSVGRLWKTPASSRKPRSPKPADGQTIPEEREDSKPTPNGESVAVHLASGGTLTLSASASLLSLSRKDREFVFSLVDLMEQYQEDNIEPENEDPWETDDDD